MAINPVQETTKAFNATNVNDTVQDVKTTGGYIQNVTIENVDPSTRYVQLFSTAASGVTLGTTTPDAWFPVPAHGFSTYDIPFGLQIGGAAISIAGTTTPTGSTAPTNDLKVLVLHT